MADDCVGKPCKKTWYKRAKNAQPQITGVDKFSPEDLKLDKIKPQFGPRIQEVIPLLETQGVWSQACPDPQKCTCNLGAASDWSKDDADSEVLDTDYLDAHGVKHTVHWTIKAKKKEAVGVCASGKVAVDPGGSLKMVADLGMEQMIRRVVREEIAKGVPNPKANPPKGRQANPLKGRRG
jgi:hypothetical protein